MMRRVVSFAAAIALAACSRSQAPATASPAGATVAVPQIPVAIPSHADGITRMIGEGMGRSHVKADLAYLLDVIGPRLTGSPAMRRANEWTQQKFREYGMDKAELEAWDFGVGWTRGPMTLRMLVPHRRELIGVSWAWAPGTNGPVTGDVVLLDARTQQDFDRRFAGKLAKKWVMIGPAAELPNPDGPAMTPLDSVRVDSIRRSQAAQTEEERRFMPNRSMLLDRENVAGVIRDGAKDFGLLNLSGSPAALSPYPYIVIGNEDYAQFERLIQRGERVSIEADVKNTFTQSALQQFNTVAEIRGSEKADEVVILGAHLDSWDLSTGATDNGTGSIAVLEAARIIKASGAKPKRTIRFVLFSGEEQGLFGSKAYAETHKKELDKVQAVLVLDNGTGRITGMALQGRDELRDMWKGMFQPLGVLRVLNDDGAGRLGPLAVRSGNKTGTDHLSFLPFGVPGFNYDQVSRGYNHTHHSQADNFNHVVVDDVAQAATIMAVNAWQLAEMAQLLPRGKKQ